MILAQPTNEQYVQCLNIYRRSFDGVERAPDGVFKTNFDAGTIFVECQDQIVGFAITRAVCGAYLWAIATEPMYRGEGIAGRLLQEIDRHCRSMNYEAINLTVKTTNPAQKLYFDNGYRVVKFLRRYYLDGGDGILMRRILR